MNTRGFSVVGCLVLALLLGSSPTWARESYRLTGISGKEPLRLELLVVDEESRALSSVRVELEGPSGLRLRFDLELDDGRRVIEGTGPAGEYLVTVSAPGFQRHSETIQVVAGSSAALTALHCRLAPALVGAAARSSSPAPPPPPPPPMPPVLRKAILSHGKRDTLELVRVFYATDRNATGSEEIRKAFGSALTDTLSYGAALVSIPRSHEMGRLERPSIFRFEFRENPNKHVMVQRLEPAEESAFFDSVRQALASLAEPRCLLYVHGYNVDFEGAMLRAGQMAYDLDLPIVPIAFSWPSLGTVRGYLADEATVELAAERVRDFMLTLRRETGVRSVDVITHSMGARAIGYALASLAATHVARDSLVGELIFSAPDVDQRRMASWLDQFRPLIGRVTIYGSARDRALWLSDELHHYKRAGEGGENVFVHAGVETIDATAVPTDFISHTQPGDGTAVTSDAYYVLRHTPVSERCCLERHADAGQGYWELKPRTR